MSNNEQLIQRAPATTRRPVLSDEPEVVAARLKSQPNTWFLIATGEKKRLGVISQTGYRIRNGLITAFYVQQDEQGRFEVTVSTDTGIKNREAEVELYARWVTDEE